MSQKSEEESGVIAVAKTLGKAAGKIASLAGVHAHAQPKATGKLPKKNKSRLPRRQKKALRKSGAGTVPMM